MFENRSHLRFKEYPSLNSKHKEYKEKLDKVISNLSEKHASVVKKALEQQSA